MQKAGHDIYWVEDPILRDDFAGLKLIQDQCGPTLVNAGAACVVGKSRATSGRALTFSPTSLPSSACAAYR